MGFRRFFRHRLVWLPSCGQFFLFALRLRAEPGVFARWAGSHKSRFFAARFARLYPLYLVMLVVATPELLTWEVRRHGMKIGMIKTAEIFAANVAMTQVWYPSRLLRINPPSWSLCGEIFFYLCFPLLGALLWKLRGARLWMAALTCTPEARRWFGECERNWVLGWQWSCRRSTCPLLRWGYCWPGGRRFSKTKGQGRIRVWQANAVLGTSAAELL